HPFARAPHVLPPQLPVHPRRTVGLPGALEDRLRLLGQLLVLLVPPRRLLLVPLVVGGSGDLEEAAGPVDAALLGLLRLDDRLHAHPSPLAKKAVARSSMSPSSPTPWRQRPPGATTAYPRRPSSRGKRSRPGASARSSCSIFALQPHEFVRILNHLESMSAELEAPERSDRARNGSALLDRAS